MLVGGYLRVSREDQALGYSLTAQRKAIGDYCASRGWEPVWYEEPGRSAWTDRVEDRPVFARMLADAHAGTLGAVVVWKLDRWARDVVLALRELRELERAGVGFVSLTESLDFTTPFGRAMLAILAVFAQLASDQTSERVAAGVAAKQARYGRNAHGAIPWGAERVDGRLRVDPALAGPLADLLALAASAGDWTVAEALVRAGVPTKRGHSWTPERVRKAIRSWRWLLEQPDPWPARYLAAVSRPRRPPVGAGKGINLLTGLAGCPCGGWLRYQRSADRPAVRLVCARPGCPHNRGRLTADVAEALVAAWFLTLVLPAIEAPGDVGATTLPARLATLAEERELLGLRLQARAIGRADFLRAIAALDAEERAAVAAAAGGTAPLGAALVEEQAYWPGEDTAGRNGSLRLYVARVIVGRAVCIEPVPGVLDTWPPAA